MFQLFLNGKVKVSVKSTLLDSIDIDAERVFEIRKTKSVFLYIRMKGINV